METGKRGLEDGDTMQGSKKKTKLLNPDTPDTKRNPTYSNFSQRLMANMGYKPGMGLGLHSTGITAPLEESMQQGRRGLGYDLDGLEKEDVQWELEEVNKEQDPVWIKPCDKPVLTEDDMTGWIALGKRKETIVDETEFCDSSILAKILDSKTIFDKLSEKEFLDARQRANPFETIRGGLFQNRAAMKMANIDAVFDFMFTSPKKDGRLLVSPNDVLYFADICAGPGGFSEYVFWRKKWHTKGFGITLKDPESGSDFKLDNFTAGPCEGFDTHYGEKGYHGDGDVTKLENLNAFSKYVMGITNDVGVHFAMADGGISVEGQENIQEILTKRLVLCQYLFAVSVLRIGGHFVCKVFDMFTPFSVGLFYLLYRSFEKICIFKPVTSRPANSERYIICYSLRPGVKDMTKYLYAINQLFSEQESDSDDVIEVVPKDLLMEEPFYSYITQCNDSIGFNQIIALKKLRYYVKNSNLQDTRQAGVRRECLELWKVPNDPRTVSTEKPAKDIFTDTWMSQFAKTETVTAGSCMDSSKLVDITVDKIPFLNENIHTWRWFFACGRKFVLVGLGRNRVMTWNCQGINPSFIPRHEFSSFELPRGTILEVELVPEMTGEGSSQRNKNFIYILDVLAVYGEKFINKPWKERLQAGEVLCNVLNKPCRNDYLQMRVKPYNRIQEMIPTFERLSIRKCKQIGDTPTLKISEDSFIAPLAVIFCKILKDPWQLHTSIKYGNLYFFNTKTNESSFEPPKSSVANYCNIARTRHIWKWTRSMYQDICEGHESKDTSSRDEMSWTKLKTKLPSQLHHH